MFYSIMSCFAAGMLLAIATVHIMPEATEIYHGYLAEQQAAAKSAWCAEHGEEEEGDHDDEHEEEEEYDFKPADPNDAHAGHGHGKKQKEPFPLAHALFVGGFLVMLAMDQVIFKKSDVIKAKINE